MAIKNNVNKLNQFEKFSILVVEDDAMNRELLSHRLQNDGFLVSEAVDGVEAMELNKIENFDLIILDLNMPRMNGFEFLEWMHNSEHERDTKIIVLSAENNRDSVVTALTLGANDYIVKPASNVELLNRVRRISLAKQLTGENELKLDMSTIAMTSIYVVDDDELNRDLVGMHLSKRGFNVKSFESGTRLLNELVEKPTDILLLDIRMPEIDGVQVLKSLREQYSQDELGIIMLTGDTNSKQIDKCYELGADDYITKPFNSTELVSRTYSVLKLKMLKAREKDLQKFSDMGQSLRRQ